MVRGCVVIRYLVFQFRYFFSQSCHRGCKVFFLSCSGHYGAWSIPGQTSLGVRVIVELLVLVKD